MAALAGLWLLEGRGGLLGEETAKEEPEQKAADPFLPAETKEPLWASTFPWRKRRRRGRR